MNKTLLYVTAAAGLIASGAALADAANVEIYGTLNTDFENVKATGATGPGATSKPGCANGTCQMGGTPNGVSEPSRNRVTSNSSNIGFRGNEDLGMGLKAIFQIESGISIDSASTTTTTGGTTSTGFFGSRNTNIGLSSTKLGTIFYGNWDTPYKALTNTAAFDSFWGTGIENDNTIIGTPGFGVASITTSQRDNSSADASFDRRQGNSVQYWTPQFYGISARLVYSANEGRASEPTTVANPNTNPYIYGASIAWDYGPFRAAYGFEQHRDYFGLSQLGGQALGTAAMGANPHSIDNGNKATLSYIQPWSAGTTSLNVAYERLSYSNVESPNAAGTDLIHYQRDMVYFAGKHQIGANTIRLGFGNAWSGSCIRGGGLATPCSTSGLNARQYSAGYSYSFSKRTDVYGFYTLITNGNFANYVLGNGAAISSTGTAAGGAAGTATTSAGIGARQQGFGLGLRHVF
jgi:predicted porin